MTEPAAVTETYTLALFDRAQDNRPKLRAFTRSELAELFGRHEFRAGKDGPAFSPTVYPPAKTRANAHVVALTLAVGDFDRGDVPPEQVRDHLAQLCVAFWLYETYSSTPAARKFRAVVLLAQPVPAGRWAEVWPALVRDLFFGAVDLGTRDASRIFYLPSAPPGSTPFTYHGDGAPFDWSKLRTDPEARKAPLTTPGDTAPIARGERRPKLMSIAGRLRNAGAGYDAILAELRKLRMVNETRCVEKLTGKDLEHVAASVCRYEPGPSRSAAPAATRGGPWEGRPGRTEDPIEFDLGNGRLLRWTPGLVSYVFASHDKKTGKKTGESPIEVIPGLFRPLRRMVVEGETYYAVEFAEGVVRTGTFQDLFDRLEKVEGRVLARAFGKDVVAQLFYRFCKTTEVGYPTYGFYADGAGGWVEAKSPTPIKDEQQKVAEEIAAAVAYEVKPGDLAAYAAFDSFYENREILPIRGLSAIALFALELRRKKLLLPHVLAWSQGHNLGKTTAELSASDIPYGREHQSASSLNSEFRFPANVDACCGPLAVEEAERFAWDKWGGDLKTAAESANVSKRGGTSLKQSRYLSRALLFFSANSCAVASGPLLVRFFVIHFAENQQHVRRTRRKEFEVAFGKLAPVGPAVAREIAHAYPTVDALLAGIAGAADEVDAECAKQGIEIRDPRRSKSWAATWIGLEGWASLATKIGDGFPLPSFPEFVREVVGPVEAGTFEGEVTPLSAFRAWLESYKVAAITRKFEVSSRQDRRTGEEVGTIRPTEIDSLKGEGRVFADGILEPASRIGEKVPGDWVTTSLLDQFNRQQPRADLRFTDLKDLQLTAIRDTDLLESDVLDSIGAVPRHPFEHSGRQRAAFVPKESWAAEHQGKRVPMSGDTRTKQSNLEDTQGHERVPLCPVVSGTPGAAGGSGHTPDTNSGAVSRHSTDEKIPFGTQGHDFPPPAREKTGSHSGGEP